MNQFNPGETKARFSSDAGIAIGPILFIIAVLGILAAAIAAGSGSFTSSTTNEGNRTRASALIEIGQNLRMGVERILGDGSTGLDGISTNTADRTATTHLFAPIGGGIAPPSTTMAAAPTTDTWRYWFIVLPGIGTTAGSLVAFLPIVAGVCDEVNNKANGIPVTGTAGGTADAATANVALTPAGTSGAPLDVTGANAWPAGLVQKLVGCVYNENATTVPIGYYFYQVLGVQ